MTKPLSGAELAEHIKDALPGTIEAWQGEVLWIKPEAVLDVCRYLKEGEGLEFNYLSSISAVDYVEYFEMVYRLTSMAHNQSAILKAKLYGREDVVLPSVVSVWHGADLQEREIWDLMGIAFTGHPNLKRVMLWEGFPGHPLRKDFLEHPR